MGRVGRALLAAAVGAALAVAGTTALPAGAAQLPGARSQGPAHPDVRQARDDVPDAGGARRAALDAGPVLAATADAAGSPVPGAEALRQALGDSVRDPSLGSLNMAVADAVTGTLLYGAGETEPVTPASTTKLATAVAALALVPPATRLATTVVRGDRPGTVVMVGGGDPTLTVLPADQIRIGGAPVDDDTAPASLADLAARTAAALKAAGTTAVHLDYDTSMYSGPLLHPEHDAMNIAAVTPLMVDEGRVAPLSPDEAPARVYDPAGQAANALADRLRAAGITVDGTPAQVTAPAGAAVLGRVFSPTVPRLIERMLTTSDNTLAEAVARQAAIAAHRPASFEGAAAATLATLAGLGVPTAGMVLADGSGLSKTDRIPALALTELLARAASPAHPELRPVLTGLPVAGFTGTLVNRFGERSGAGQAAGLVRAKTGTLSGVNTLAGTVVDADGRVLTFALMTRTGAYPGSARDAVDRIVARLASCGCR
ncbi:D-alanyl-D-alanine carboxypeptidase/D-alanyl-D-alanine endopeptidase [Kitasatospora paranensis]|uniref:D-alanyl-D-alanine carboxypeptidase/D-alanyl-D-alanine endopeptidase n=1 Tax=Kitasatospora paranensis TaxID=258053 RepID=UPI0031EE3C8F